MSLEYKAIYTGQELYHHGIKGQKWGIRRFQNPDGTWTKEGLKRRHSTQKAIATAAGLAVGGTLGTVSAVAVNPIAIAGSGVAGLTTRNAVLNIQQANEDYALGSRNPVSSINMNVKQTKKYNKKIMNDSDYLTALKNISIWMPSNSKEYKEYSNELYDISATYNGKQLKNFMKNEYGDSPEQIKNHLKKSMRGLNEASELESPYSGELFCGQMYNNVTNAYAKGFIDSKTFNNFYDSAITGKAASILSEYDVSQPHYRENLKAIIDEGDRLYSKNKANGVGRLDNWFSETPELNPERQIKHYYITNDFLYGI